MRQFGFKDLETIILSAIWALEDISSYSITVNSVYDYLKENNTERSYNTVKTVMDRLCKKSLLTRFKMKNKFYYRTAQSKKEMLLKDIDRISKVYFNGNFDSLLITMNSIANENKILAEV